MARLEIKLSPGNQHDVGYGCAPCTSSLFTKKSGYAVSVTGTMYKHDVKSAAHLSQFCCRTTPLENLASSKVHKSSDQEQILAIKILIPVAAGSMVHACTCTCIEVTSGCFVLNEELCEKGHVVYVQLHVCLIW